MENTGIFYGYLEYFTVIWYILWPFGNVVVIWYIFPRFGILCQEKSGNPGPFPEHLPWPDGLADLLLCLGESDIMTDCHRMTERIPGTGEYLQNQNGRIGTRIGKAFGNLKRRPKIGYTWGQCYDLFYHFFAQNWAIFVSNYSYIPKRITIF
jgi:hypothetical protein